MAKPQLQHKPARTPEEIRANKLSKPEDALAFALSAYLAGQPEVAAEIYPHYFDEESGQFKGNAASANHKGMAAALALLLAGSKMARLYWIGRLKTELGEYFGLGECRSNKYQHWSLASIALVWEWAKKIGDRELQDLAGRVYAGTLASWSLGGTSKPSRLTAGKWSGLYVSGPGIRSDPGHLEGDSRACILQAELYPEIEVKDVYRVNARRRAASVKAVASLGDRKLVSELWWLDAIDQARRGGLALPEELADACRACLESTVPDSRLAPLLAGALHGTHFPFHFLYYPEGSRVTYIEGTTVERCVFADRVDQDGSVHLAFPYPANIAKTARGGTCGVEGGRVVARNQHAEASIALPEGDPAMELVWGPDGLKTD